MASILLFLAVIPVIVICTYIYLKDRNKEPWSLLIKLFVLGISSCFLVLMISGVLFEIFPFMNKDTAYMTFFEVMAYAFIGVAFIEELCKWLMVYIGSYTNKAYDELYDGIVYSVYVSLGFAFLENLLYVFKNQSIVVGISRGLLAVPGHACDAVFMEEATQFTEFQYQTLTECSRSSGIMQEKFIPRMYFTCNPGGKILLNT